MKAWPIIQNKEVIHNTKQKKILIPDYQNKKCKIIQRFMILFTDLTYIFTKISVKYNPTL